jgi:hypothetical protein
MQVEQVATALGMKVSDLAKAAEGPKKRRG